MLTEKMKLSHIIYKVDDLDKAFSDFKHRGFNIEYGKAQKPYNALIYFGQGPYLELLQTSKFPKFVNALMALMGKKIIGDRFTYWNQQAEGLVAVAIENDRGNLDQEIKILEKYHLKYAQIKSNRQDTKGRLLKFISLFPEENKIPFLGAYRSNVQFRPAKDYVHPNGVVGIKSISFGTKEEYVPIIKDLTDDPGLKLFIGDGVKDLEFAYQDKAL